MQQHPPPQQPQQPSTSDLREGKQAFYFSKRLTIAPCACPPCIPLPQPLLEPNCSVIDSTATGLTSLFTWIATNNKGPTVTARYLYLYFFTVVAAYNWLTASSVFSGTIDGWNWDETANMSPPSPQESYVWLNHTIAELAPLLFKGGPGTPPDFSLVLTMELDLFNWTPEQQVAATAKIREKGKWALFLTRWNTWNSARLQDGSATLPTPTSTQIVNIAEEIQVWSPTLPTFVDPSKWTPLRILTAPSKQSYLTFFWDTVASTGITIAQEQNIDTFSDTYFPRPNERTAELQTIIDLTAHLTDSQKVQAEFWAGGPRTVTPPGMMAWFWRDFVLSQSSMIGPTRALFSGLDLAVHLFEGSRITWRQKSRHCQSRPIQDIRIGWSGQQLGSWNGTTVQADLWMPYQEASFVTPPFADFPSGHSHFSQAFALVMTNWFGQDIPTTQVNRGDMTFISAIYSGAAQQIGAYNTITFPAGASAIQPSQVPAQAVELAWSTWQDLANSAGLSRLYGGIHCMSAHTSSQAIARKLDAMIQAVWTRK